MCRRPDALWIEDETIDGSRLDGRQWTVDGRRKTAGL
jgi:hypothetical protein